VSPPPPPSIEPRSSLAGMPATAVTPAAVESWLGTVAGEVVRALGVPPLALLLGGSHAAGEGVWTRFDDRRVTLSDLDLWAVFPDERARRVAAQRLEAAMPALTAAATALGVLAPVEVMLVTPATLAQLPARPATLELRARGRAVAGDPSWLERVPGYAPREVPAEERLLLLENRAFELLWAHDARAGGTPLGALRARHAVLKTALELVAVLALAHGELPLGATARVAWARTRLAGDRALAWLPATGLETLWEAALAWRAGAATALPESEAAAEWRRAVSAWVAVWRHVSGAGGADPVAHALALAARAPWPRRVRRSLRPLPGAEALGLGGRLAAARHGTPQHRLGGSAAILLVAAAGAGATSPVLDPAASRALRSLAVAPVTADWAEAARALTHRWDIWVLGGRRGTVAA